MSNANRKPSGMVIENTGGKDFEPDALLDVGRDYEARIIGFVHIGKHEKDKMGDKGPTGEKEIIEQAIITFELTEEDTYVPRGPEGSEVLAPRTIPKWIKWSSHEKSNLFKIAGHANKNAVWIEGGNGKVDPVLMLDQPISLTLKNNKDNTKQNIAETAPIPAKYKDGVGASKGAKHMFSAMGGAFADTTIEDVPVWILKQALTKAVNAEEFTQLEAMEDRVEAADKAKEAAKGGKLEGDDKPAEQEAEPAKKPTRKRAAAKKPDPIKEEAPAEEEDELGVKPAAKPARRARKNTAAKPEVDYSVNTIEELEVLLEEKGLTDDELDALALDGDGESLDDAGYKEALVAAAVASK